MTDKTLHTEQNVAPEVLAEAQRQYNILSEGAAQIVPEGGLMKKLIKSIETKTPLRVKFGMDPTAPDIHLGHTVVLQVLRKFQDLGHVAIPLIGDYTTLIGDPSGRDKTRPPLTPEKINDNAKTYFDQAFKVLDKEESKLDLRYNSEWLSKLSFADTIKLCSQVTVAQMIQREGFANRLEAGTPISMHELLYPVMQGYDSVALDCDIELGGTDQTFNCLMGRQLMSTHEMSPQIVMTFPIIEGLDGVEKMSKSKNNYVGVSDAPNDMFGKMMSIPDELMPKYFSLLTNIAKEDIPSHPMEAKKALAAFIVTRFHNEDAAKTARADFETRFSKREIPTDLPEFKLTESEMGLLNLLVNIKFAPSVSEARRLVQQGAVKIDGEKIEDVKHTVSGLPEFTLQAGKRRMGKVFMAA